ncbi:MAG: hypothetical protein WCI05_02520 [Myxococcales bacterium]
MLWSKTLGFGAVLVAVGCISSPVWAYPSSVVFAPTGEAKGFGETLAYAYTSVMLSPELSGQTGASWSGVNFGVLPKVPYGKSGVSFGGLEVGVDWLFFSGGKGKTVFNGKLQLVTETTFTPHVAVGFSQWSAFQPSLSLNMGYVSLTKTLRFGEHNFGAVTAGMEYNFTDDPRVSGGGSWPFRDEKYGLLLGYLSPEFGPISVGIDHVAGYNELASTYFAVNLQVLPGSYITFGGFMQNNRRDQDRPLYDGAFFFYSMSFNTLKLVGLQKDPPPPLPTAAPAPAPTPH